MKNAGLTSERVRTIFLAASMFGVCAFLGACAKQETAQQQEQTSVAPAQPTESAAPPTNTQATPTPSLQATPENLLPPRPAEVRDALARIYEKSVAVDESRSAPALVGDFNGDGSEDIAVVVKPSASMIEELNSEVANWIVEDPRKVLTPADALPDSHPGAHGGVVRRPSTEERARIQSGDTLLAVIHGYKDAGWRNPQAKQTYLLRNAAGDALTRQPRRAALDQVRGKPRRPDIRGDVINERLQDETGFLYWTGAKYGWHRI